MYVPAQAKRSFLNLPSRRPRLPPLFADHFNLRGGRGAVESEGGFRLARLHGDGEDVRRAAAPLTMVATGTALFEHSTLSASLTVGLFSAGASSGFAC